MVGKQSASSSYSFAGVVAMLMLVCLRIADIFRIFFVQYNLPTVRCNLLCTVVSPWTYRQGEYIFQCRFVSCSSKCLSCIGVHLQSVLFVYELFIRNANVLSDIRSVVFPVSEVSCAFRGRSTEGVTSSSLWFLHRRVHESNPQSLKTIQLKSTDHWSHKGLYGAGFVCSVTPSNR